MHAMCHDPYSSDDCDDHGADNDKNQYHDGTRVDGFTK